MFAKHIDNKSTYKNNLQHQITTVGYNCDRNNTVAESSFVTDPQIFPVPLFISYCAYLVKDNSYSSISKVYSQLRGPPMNII